MFRIITQCHTCILYGGMVLTLWRATTLFLPSVVVTAVSLTIQTQFSKSRTVIVSGVWGSASLSFYQTQSIHSVVLTSLVYSRAWVSCSWASYRMCMKLFLCSVLEWLTLTNATGTQTVPPSVYALTAIYFKFEGISGDLWLSKVFIFY